MIHLVKLPKMTQTVLTIFPLLSRNKSFPSRKCFLFGYFTNPQCYRLSFDRSDEANKAFSAAVQMHDILVKAWALWGNYLEQIFCKDR